MRTSELILRVGASIVVLVIMARINGPKQISQMNFYDYVVGIVVGSLAASVSLNADIQIQNGLAAIVLYMLAGTFMSWLARKSMILRRFLSGTPIPLIVEGQICWQGLNRAHMNVNELLSGLRYGGYFDVSEVAYAVLEPTGKLSIQPKGTVRPPKLCDLQIASADAGLYANVMIDGKILSENLKDYGKDENWLNGELKRQGFKDLEAIGLATLNAQGALSVYPKNLQKVKHTPLM